MSTEKNIVIVGGGFAGTTLVRELDGKLPPGYRLLLISEESHTTFNPMLPEAVGASIFPEQVVAPIREMITKAHFIMGRVNQVDPARFSARRMCASTSWKMARFSNPSLESARCNTCERTPSGVIRRLPNHSRMARSSTPVPAPTRATL